MSLKKSGLRGSLRSLSTGVAVIPDSVVHQYDASELSLSDGDTVSSWPDAEGTRDLSAIGAPTYTVSRINGNATVYYDGSDDGHTNSNLTQSQPDYVVGVFEVVTPGNDPRLWTGDATRQIGGIGTTGGNWQAWAGDSFIRGGSPDTNPHIFGGFYDGAGSEVRVDGSVVATGDLGANSLDGLDLGEGDGHNEYYLGELLILDNPSSGDIGGAESYLSDKWGITV